MLNISLALSAFVNQFRQRHIQKYDEVAQNKIDVLYKDIR